MLRNKGLKSAIWASMFLLLVTLPSISFAATIQGYVAGIIQFKRTRAMDKALKGEDLKKLGWTKTKTHYQQTISLSMFSVSLDDSERQELMEGGVFSLEAQPGEHTVYTFDVEGNEVDARKVFVDNKNSVVQVPIIILKDMDNNCCLFPQRGNVAKKKAPPCLDYNNPYGDYENANKGKKRYDNFWDSDCHRAMKKGYCWAELMPGISCNHGGDNCSKFIGHPSNFHCHLPE